MVSPCGNDGFVKHLNEMLGTLLRKLHDPLLPILRPFEPLDSVA